MKGTVTHSPSLRLRCTLTKALPAILALSTTFMAWKGLCIFTASPNPVVVVVSESMAPAFHRGDILLLWNRSSCVQVGEVPVVWFAGNPLPMVHRAVKVFNLDCSHDDPSSRQLMVTKGDNNEFEDIPLYPAGRQFISRDEVKGLVTGYLPFLGWMVIGLQEVVWVKYLLFVFASYVTLVG
ncbi:Signal peptidase complex catalytic subunit SEC11 [Lachnellula arida]|uniref:Signal peptidase complex catalytic subunit SEC11 n=1 Tax=Lachnellula arida TaxID=1316785 RepID=A0A8T9B9Q9_9HELO|nr:Signal peptidase complex catalytic subunit SEC11 [Lachnellula arida]